jgi:hypothetical protein
MTSALLSSTGPLASGVPSAKTTRDVISVDVRGLKAALMAQANARGVSVSVLVREALSAVLPKNIQPGAPQTRAAAMADARRARVSLRLAPAQAAELNSRARRAGLLVGGYVVNLMRQAGEPPSGADRTAHIEALTRSNAELASLSRHIAGLTSLLREGQFTAARPYRQMLQTLQADVRAHLALAATSLAMAPMTRAMPQRKHTP